MLFYATFFIGLLIYQDKPQQGEIPFIRNAGLIGVRSWHCKTYIDSIRIRYPNDSGSWEYIPDVILYNKANWKMYRMNDEKLTKEIKEGQENRSKMIGSDASDYIFNDSSIIMQNCALIFYPTNFRKSFHDIRFTCRVRFVEINKPINKLYPGFQIQTFIDTTITQDNNGAFVFSDLCLQFNLGMNGNHHPWIPGLDYEPPVKYVSPINKIIRYGNFDNMKVGKDYSISAIVYNRKILFLGHQGGSVKLFEAQLGGEE